MWGRGRVWSLLFSPRRWGQVHTAWVVRRWQSRVLTQWRRSGILTTGSEREHQPQTSERCNFASPVYLAITNLNWIRVYSPDAHLEARFYMQASFKPRTYLYLLHCRKDVLEKIKLFSSLVSADYPQDSKHWEWVACVLKKYLWRETQSTL